VLIDDFLPTFDVVARHRVEVRAPAPRVYAAVRAMDLRTVTSIRVLFWLRERPARLRHAGSGTERLGLTLDELLRHGFILLAERPPHELLLGLVGRFWTASGHLERLDAGELRRFDRPGYAKAAWNFSLTERDDGRVRLATETRVLCLDGASRARFRRYWLVVEPFSGLTRRAMLSSIRRDAERSLPTPPDRAGIA